MKKITWFFMLVLLSANSSLTGNDCLDIVKAGVKNTLPQHEQTLSNLVGTWEYTHEDEVYQITLNISTKRHVTLTRTQGREVLVFTGSLKKTSDGQYFVDKYAFCKDKSSTRATCPAQYSQFFEVVTKTAGHYKQWYLLVVEPLSLESGMASGVTYLKKQ